MDLFQGAILILFGLTVSNLVVGVSNDAVNFLNSSIGSRVAPRYIIMIIASAGMLAGVTFSSGMMEVARKGIFHPEFFTMPELMVVFLAVMLTNILLLDLYNTFGLPTSTTVSIVFELLGAAVAVSLLKLHAAGASLGGVLGYINTGTALAIIAGILLSVVIAFMVGAVVQFACRLIFTFDFEPRLRPYGALFGGAALSSIVYFIFIKGAKGASFLSTEAVNWIDGHTGLILLGVFGACSLLLQLVLWFTRVHILKIIVLCGTFALAMAFAANDLVNFIGVPLAGLRAYGVASDSGDLIGQTMEALQQPVRSNTLILLIAGSIMVITLWFSKKSRTVTKTEINLGRQHEGYERFESTALSRAIVRFVATMMENTSKAFPGSVRRWVNARFDRSRFRPSPREDGTVPSFDLIRASVNLVVASALIALATSYKLPLSTTYVTFMVSMGTSLSDQAWGKESAVYRVTGVLTVIGGWFFTALMAFTFSSVFACIIHFGQAPAVLGVLALAVVLVIRSRKVHDDREQEEQALDVFNLRKITEADSSIAITFQHAGLFLAEVRSVLDTALEGLFAGDRVRLKEARIAQRKVQQSSNIIAANVFKVLRLLQREDVEDTHRYAQTISALQEISESLRDIVMRAYTHVSNNHSGFLDSQVTEISKVRDQITRILDTASAALARREPLNMEAQAKRTKKLKKLVKKIDQNQITRIQDNSSKTRLSILFYSITWDCLKIGEHTNDLLTVFQEPLGRGLSDD